MVFWSDVQCVGFCLDTLLFLETVSVLSPESSMGSIIQKMFAVNSHHHTP